MSIDSQPNQVITIEETDIVDIDGHPVDVPVKVLFQLSPYPRVVIESEQLPVEVLGNETLKVSMRNGAQLDVMCLFRMFSPGEGSLIPKYLPSDVLDKKVPLKSVRFGILNFPKFFGSEYIRTESSTAQTHTPHIKLEASGWQVEITGVANLDDVLDELNRDGGYGFTYYGVISRMDRTTFSVEEVTSLLEVLRIFLSFVRGNYCSLALLEGEDELGERTWVRWGAHYVEGWKPRRSWFLSMGGGNTLLDLFPNFVSLLEREGQSMGTLSHAIDWYLQSNESATHVGIILTEAALERLSYHVLRRRRETDGTESVRKYIENALKELKLDRNLPPACNEIRKLKNWHSGPHAITTIRNDLVHPIPSLSDVSLDVHHEVWNLAQWYVEMILLKELSYQGKYRNRQCGGDRNGAIQPVPWAHMN